MKELYSSEYTIRLSDTDAAGVLFFASIFKIIHDKYEEWLDKYDIKIIDILRKEKYIIPITHSHAHYMMPLFLSEKVKVRILLREYTKARFTLEYVFEKNGQTACQAETRHVFIEKGSREKIEIPENFLRMFK